MDLKKPTVFMTGATGTMGTAALEELIKDIDKIKLKLLVRDSSKNKSLLSKHMNNPSIEIIWGDLLSYENILEGVKGSDYIFHIGGMVSPQCDTKPYLTLKTNITAVENITKAILEQENKDNIKLVYIGSVAETGDRNYPRHWGRTGDPIKISIYDHYALSKVLAEKHVVESGIKNWVSLRLSGIVFPNILKSATAITFHVPLNGVLEWCTVEDSGTLIRKVLLEDLKGNLGKNFWGRFFNVGSGKEYRLTNYEFESLTFDCLGMPGVERVFEPNWFATKNFHGHFYYDGDKLEEMLHFRENLPVKDYFKRLGTKVSYYLKLGGYIPSFLVAPATKMYMKRIAYTKELGTLDWIYNKNNQRINIYFGGIEEYNKIPSTWDKFELMKFEKENSSGDKFICDHGYDETKNEDDLDINDMKKAAEFRGGECLSENMNKGDLKSKLKWKCGYCKCEFEASPCLILLGGYWCPQCYIPVKQWDYDNIAKSNPFFAQVWDFNHSKNECNVYKFDDLFMKDGIKMDDLY